MLSRGGRGVPRVGRARGRVGEREREREQEQEKEQEREEQQEEEEEEQIMWRAILLLLPSSESISQKMLSLCVTSFIMFLISVL